MPDKSNALLSKKVKKNEPSSSKKTFAVFGVFALLTLLLLVLFLDTRLKKTTVIYEDFLTASFNDASLPSGYQSDATLHYDGNSGYLLYEEVGQTLRTPNLESHPSYRVSFRVAVLNVVSPEPYNESEPTFTLNAYDIDGVLRESREIYNPQADTTYRETFLNAEEIHAFALKLHAYANLDGYQATAGIDDLIIQTPREDQP